MLQKETILARSIFGYAQRFSGLALVLELDEMRPRKYYEGLARDLRVQSWKHIIRWHPSLVIAL